MSGIAPRRTFVKISKPGEPEDFRAGAVAGARTGAEGEARGREEAAEVVARMTAVDVRRALVLLRERMELNDPNGRTDFAVAIHPDRVEESRRILPASVFAWIDDDGVAWSGDGKRLVWLPGFGPDDL